MAKKNKTRREAVVLTGDERLAQAVLRGFFDDPLGFGDMRTAPRMRAVKALERCKSQSSVV